MNRTMRRATRKEAMMNTIERINSAIRRIDCSAPDWKETFHKLKDQKDYIAQQIAEASYTTYSMKPDQCQVQRIFSNVDAFGCPEWVKWDIEQLAASRRRWSIETSKYIWLGE